MFFKALLFVALAPLYPAPSAAQQPVPALKARVTDLTRTLDAQQVAALEHTLAEFESRKGPQLAVLLVPTTQPETPVEYGVRVYDAWKLGRKGVDDGALLLVAKNDRKVWIVTGRGVEGALTDAVVRRTVEEDITPRFKQGDFYGGIRAGVDRMMRLLEGEAFPPPRSRGEARGATPDIFQWVVIAFFIALIGGPIVRGIFGRGLGAGLAGGGLGAFAWLVGAPLLLIGLIGFVAFFIVLVGGFGRGAGWSSGGWGGGGFGGGGFGGGGFGGGGGGGGFSGGGGSTAGGGAGGSW